MDQVVHHVDRQADGPGAHRHRHAEVAGAGAQDGDDAGKIGGERIALDKFDTPGIGSIDARDIAIAVGRVPAHPRARGQQQAQLGAHQLACAEQQDRAGLQIEENRQESHSILRFPRSGVD